MPIITINKVRFNMKKTTFAAIFLAAILMLEGCSENSAVTSSETQTAAPQATTAATEALTIAAETQSLPKKMKNNRDSKSSRQLLCKRF